MDELRRKLLAKQVLPEGWGRSVVGGKEIITRPSQIAQSAPKQPEAMDPVEASGFEIDSPDASPTIDLANNKFDAFPEMIPNPNGWVGDYHKDDLLEQYNEMLANNSEDEMNQMVLDLDKPDLDEGGQFLGNAVKFGRLSK